MTIKIIGVIMTKIFNSKQAKKWQFKDILSYLKKIFKFVETLSQKIKKKTNVSKVNVTNITNKQSAFNSSNDLINFETFFTPECKSELKKCLTKEIWEQYKN